MRKHGRKRQPLTNIDVDKLRDPGRYGDGHGGLYLAVSPTRAKSWLFIGTLHGKRHVKGLGGADTVSLAEARRKAAELREQLKKNIPPTKAQEVRALARAQRVAEKANAVTFGQAADELLESLFRSWRSRKHERQWHRSLDVYCAPLRPLPVSKIAAADADRHRAFMEQQDRNRGAHPRQDRARARLRQGQGLPQWREPGTLERRLGGFAAEAETEA